MFNYHTYSKEIYNHFAEHGYAVFRNFLDRTNIDIAYANFLQAPALDIFNLKMLDDKTIFNSEVFNLLSEIVNNLNNTGTTNVNRFVGGLYFHSIANYAYTSEWHQEHGSYYLFQTAKNYLNFYTVIKKPDSNLSNLKIIPTSNIIKFLPEYANQILEHGATRYFVENNTTTMFDEFLDKIITLPLNIEDIAVTPMLSEGDMLVFRGDVIHSTQDNLTERVALSLRYVNDSTVASLSQMNKTLEICDNNYKNQICDTAIFNTIKKVYNKKNTDTVFVKEICDYLEFEYDFRKDFTLP
jgi:ectoine hydroxylase-related dioxygenase (phytanoyl-CoA dioxygenase family)